MRKHSSSARTLLCALLLLAACASAQAQPAQPAHRLRPFQREGKWGYVDASGREVIAPRFNWAEEFSEGLAAFEGEDGRHGYIDETGRVVIEPRFDSHTDFSEGLAAVSEGLPWGYIDKTGAWAIPPRFTSALPFSDGLASVRFPDDGAPPFPRGLGKSAFIDRTGRVVIAPERSILNGRFSEGIGAVQFISPTKLEEVYIDKTGKVVVKVDEVDLDGFRDGLAPARKGRLWGYVDAGGNFLIEPQFGDAHAFSEGLAAVLVGEKWGYIDRTGRLVIKPKYDLSFYDSERHAFSEGLALVYHDGRCVYLDKTGKTAFKVQCREAGRFIGGLASVEIGEDPDLMRGYVNRQGKYVWGPTRFKYKSNEKVFERIQKEAEKKEVLRAPGGSGQSARARLVSFQKGDLYGYADLSGRVVIRPRFDSVVDFKEGLAAVEVKGQWGFVNRRGVLVIRPRFEGDQLHEYQFSEGLAAVRVAGKWGCVDRSGRVVIEPKIYNSSRFSGGLAWVNGGREDIDRRREVVGVRRPDELGGEGESLGREPKIKPPPPSPAALAQRREQIYQLIFDGRYQHDGAGELLYIGDMTSVPALLRVLKDNPGSVLADGRRSYICTYAHAVAALTKITGHKAHVYEDWVAWWDEYQKTHPSK